MEPVHDGTLLQQTARFRPRGLLGRVYWYAVAPFHRLVFPGLINGIARDAIDGRTGPPAPHLDLVGVDAHHASGTRG